MPNMFDLYAQKRAKEQEEIMRVTSSARNDDHGPRTVFNMAMSLEDKKFIKKYAVEKGVSVADLFHEFVESLRKKEES